MSDWTASSQSNPAPVVWSNGHDGPGAGSDWDDIPPTRPGGTRGVGMGRGRGRGRGRGGFDMSFDSSGSRPRTGYGSGRFPNQGRDEFEQDMEIWGGGGGMPQTAAPISHTRVGTWDGGRGGTNSRSRGRGFRGPSTPMRGSFHDYQGYRDDRSHDSRDGHRFGRPLRSGGSRYSNASRSSDGNSRGDEFDDRPKPYCPEDEPEENLFTQGISSGINFSKYEHIPCKVSGDRVPDGLEMTAFSESGLHDKLLANVRNSGYQKPTPVQKKALPIIMAGRDLMACAQTGSGKTASFLLPILHTLIKKGFQSKTGAAVQTPEVVVLAPTRELALQIHNEARKFSQGTGIRSLAVYGGTSVAHVMEKIRKISPNILVATPGRLLQYVRDGCVQFSALRYFVLDEADRMLDLGFLSDMQTIVRDPTMPSKGARRHTLMFSATFPQQVQQVAAEFLDDYLFLAVGTVGGACDDVEQSFIQVSKIDKRDKLKSILEDLNVEKKKTLVFVEQKKLADFLAAYLSQIDFPTTSIHGDRYQQEREEALADFKSGRKPILVATAVAARGLDIKDVTHVINYDLPKAIDEYVHRIGRTGRVGNTGLAVSFYDAAENGALSRDLVRILGDAQQPVPDWLQQEADRNLGSAIGGNAMGGPFAGKDIRSSKGTSRIFADPNMPLVEEESWD